MSKSKSCLSVQPVVEVRQGATGPGLAPRQRLFGCNQLQVLTHDHVKVARLGSGVVSFPYGFVGEVQFCINSFDQVSCECFGQNEH